jgi:hypothetical protein
MELRTAIRVKQAGLALSRLQIRAFSAKPRRARSILGVRALRRRKGEKVRRIRGFAVAAVVALVFASAALAQDAYNSDAGDVQGQVSGGTAGSDGGAGALPFTGLDLFLLVGAGAVLLTGGLVLRRLAKAKS